MPLDGIPAWRDQSIELFHGTLDIYVPSILHSVDEKIGQPLKDFGRGFYTTTNLQKALDWAYVTAHRYGGNPAVIQFDVSRNDLAQLECLIFIRGEKEAIDFWSFIQYCRTIPGDHNRVHSAWYDLVVGPVTGTWKRQTIISDADQISFHTPHAAHVLDASPKRRI